jgi:phosphoribosylformylglycinamidine cyclo-ligase
LIEARGRILNDEMLRVFNIGIGMVIIAAPGNVAFIRRALDEECWVIGELVRGEKRVSLL